MSCVIDDVLAPSPVLEVSELSQICEGLARQRPEDIQMLLNAIALIAPLLNAIPDVVFFVKDVQARYLRYQPEAAGYLALGDFRFFRMEPDKARFIGGFGRIGWVAACPPPLQLDARTEAGLVDALSRLAPSGTSVLGLDFEGLDVRICGVFRRLALDRKSVV